MMLHPALLAIAACDAAAIVLLIMAAVTSASVVSGWDPGARNRTQLLLERRAEAASIQGRWVLGIFGLGSLILVVALAGVLPTIVPGAMCGTGVVQATGGLATRALGLRLLALGLLGAWGLHDRLDRTLPTAPLAVTSARFLLLATPVLLIAALNTWNSLVSLDVHTPVDCCAVVFDQVSSIAAATSSAGIPDAVLTRLTLGMGMLLLVAAGWILIAPGKDLTLRAALLGLLSLLWVPLAALAMVRVFSAYHYGVLHHHCPWCLFLAEHRLVGYPLFGMLLVVLLDGVGATLAARIAASAPTVQAIARRRVRRGALRLIAAVLIFGLIAGVPAMVWRLRHGVWMTG